MRISSASSTRNRIGPTVTETTPLLPQPQAEELAPVQSEATLPWSQLVPALASLWLILFLAAADGTIVVTLASVISSSFNASEKSAWLGSSYLLTVCAFSPVYGRLSDILGRKGSMLVAVSFFTLGTLGCGLAPSMDILLLSRAFAGIGGGGILLCGSIILTDLVPLRQRGVYQGLTNILFGAGAGLGGVLGGLAVAISGSWRPAFALQIPLLLLASFCILTFIKIPSPSSEQSLKQKLVSVAIIEALALVSSHWFHLFWTSTFLSQARIDYLGSFFLILGVSSLLLSLSFLSADNVPFSNPKVYGLLISAFGFLAIFVLVEGLVVSEPILPLKLLRSRATLCVGGFYFLSSVAYYSFIFNFAIYFQAVRLQSSKEAGMHLLPLSVFTSSGSLLSGLYMRSTGRYFSVNLICSLLAVSGIFYISTWSEATSELGEYLGACPSGFGIAANYTFLLIALLAKVDKSEQAVATGMIYLFRSLGQVVGVALSGALLQSVLTQQLESRLTGDGSENYISIIRHDATAIPALPSSVQKAATESYAFALSRVFFWVTVIQILCIPLCAGVGSGNLGKPEKGMESGREESGERSE